MKYFSRSLASLLVTGSLTLAACGDEFDSGTSGDGDGDGASTGDGDSSSGDGDSSSSGDGDSGSAKDCEKGEERCGCFDNDTCFDDLACFSGICVKTDDNGDPIPPTGGDGDGDGGGGNGSGNNNGSGGSGSGNNNGSGGSTSSSGGSSGGDGDSDPVKTYPHAPPYISSISMDGYVDTATWEGNSWQFTGLGSSLTRHVVSDEFCATATLAKDGGTFVQLAFDTNDKLTWNPSGTSGVTYRIRNDAATPIRLFITTKVQDGGMSVNQEYCYQIDHGGSSGVVSGSIEWSDFQDKCWLGAEDFVSYNGSDPIIFAAVGVPGDSNKTQAAAFCVGDYQPY